MADFTEIIQEIDDEIKTNGKKGIDGKTLNGVLKDMMASVDTLKTDALKVGSVFGGFVYPPDEIPFGDDYRYFYLAYQQGYYSQFGIILDNDYALIMFSYDETGETWESRYIAITPNGLAQYVKEELLYYKLGFPEFSKSKKYNEGETVTYEGSLWVFVNSHSGEWDSDDVHLTTLYELLFQ